MQKHRAPHPWWQRTTVYQIYPRSFYDTNGDGIGDLPGIIDKLGYLRDLGVETLWLSPFVKSPQRDFGYDISDHYAVAPEYGTLADCERLVKEAHARGLRLVLDMVLNHTSDEHPWFVESRASRDNPRRDFYIWRKGRKKGAPPNNWRSLTGPRGWRYDARTDEWYFASFLPFQPDLNYRNPSVKSAMLDVVRHWLGFGFDGLRLDIFNCIYKDASFADNPFSLRPLPSEDNPDGFFQAYANNVNHPDTLAFARTLRRVVDEFSDPERFMVGEVFGAPAMLRRYCVKDGAGSDDCASDGLHLVFLFKSLRTPFSERGFRELITELEREFPPPLCPTYVFGNHDRPRWNERLGYSQEKAKLLCALQMTVRGVPFVYYGEEIGMRNLDLPMSAAQDPMAHSYGFLPTPVAHALRRRGVLVNRDECRGPMQWDPSPNAGFTSDAARPWLPVHPRSVADNVLSQTADAGSLLSFYKEMLALRRQHAALHSGRLDLLPRTQNDVLAYRRFCDEEALTVQLNFSAEPQAVTLPAGATVLASTHGKDGAMSIPADGRSTLRPFEARILR